jgi:hypothetical protein
MNKLIILALAISASLAGCTISSPTTTGASGVAPVTQASDALSEAAFSSPMPSAPPYAMESLLANSVYWISNRVHGKIGWSTNGMRETFSSMRWSFESTAPIIRNANCWLKGVKGLTAISPFNLQAAFHGPGTAVSPRHILMVTHLRSQPGTVFQFITADNQVVSRKLIAYSDSKKLHDMSIGLLESDLPASIGFMRVMPPLWRQLMPEAFLSRRTPAFPNDRNKAQVHPVVAFNHWKQAFVTDFAGYGVLLDKSLWFPDWFGYAAGGDSGHPVCVLANDELFLVTLYTTPSGGNLYPDFISVINTEMEELSVAHKAPIYRLTAGEELMSFKPRTGSTNSAPLAR